METTAPGIRTKCQVIGDGLVPIGTELNRRIERYRRCERARDEFAARIRCRSRARPIGNVSQEVANFTVRPAADLRDVPCRPYTEFVVAPVRPIHDDQPGALSRRRVGHEVEELGMPAENVGHQVSRARLDAAQRHWNTHHAGDLSQPGAAVDKMDGFAFAAA